MAQPLPSLPHPLTREDYRRWAEAQPRGRSELAAGEIVAMAPERGAHLRVKLAVAIALRQAIIAAGVPCQALPDGATVEIGDDTDYEPDCTVNCGSPMDDDAVAAPNPVIVVEVLSPSTRGMDTGAKLADYFRVPSIQHYLIVHAKRHLVIHHRRGGNGIHTQFPATGPIPLDPPGISIMVEELYAP